MSVSEVEPEAISDDSNDSDSTAGSIPPRSVSNVGVPERIILCVDRCRSDPSNPSPVFATLKRLVSLFLHSKRSIDDETRFALVLLEKERPVWAHPFTENPIDIMLALDARDSEADDEAEFDASPLIDLILANADMPDVDADYKLTPPPYVVRTLLIYNRSDLSPILVSDRKVFDVLVKLPYFTLDILYLHDDAERSKTFDALQSFDNGYSYIFAAPTDSKKMFECGAKLLAHPLQRPLQKDTRYNFPR